MIMILSVLKQKELDKLKVDLSNGVPYHSLRRAYPRFTKNEAAIFYEYVREYKNQSSVGFGSKDQPYFEGDFPDEPTYTWHGLSSNEKKFYEENNERLRKTQSLLFKK